MLPIKPAGKISTVAAVAGLLLLASCGGGGGGAEHAPAPATATPPIADEGATPLPVTPAELPPSTPSTIELSSGQSDALAAPETIALASAYTGLVAGTLYSPVAWPVWWGTGKPVDGVNCLASSAYHKHALISIYKNGQRLGFPDGIGRVHAGCYHAYEMHVHDATGIVHIEADVAKQFKLGQWFSLWQQPLGATNTAGLPGPVRFYVIENEKITPWLGEPKDIDIKPHREILIVTGTKMTTVPKYLWPSGI
jgi:hypothetical protein